MKRPGEIKAAPWGVVIRKGILIKCSQIRERGGAGGEKK